MDRPRPPNIADHDQYHAPDSSKKPDEPKPRLVDIFAGKGSVAGKVKDARIKLEKGIDVEDQPGDDK
jgi:hypothetical protein